MLWPQEAATRPPLSLFLSLPMLHPRLQTPSMIQEAARRLQQPPTIPSLSHLTPLSNLCDSPRLPLASSPGAFFPPFSLPPPDLPSFPTRRSSDLPWTRLPPA